MIKLQPIPAMCPWQVPAAAAPLAPDPVFAFHVHNQLFRHITNTRHQSQLPFPAAATVLKPKATTKK